jgi:hypothetical protein
MKLSQFKPRLIALLLAYIAGAIWLVVALLPSAQTPSLVVEGVPAPLITGGRMSDEGIQIQEVVLSCSANLFGLAYHCPKFYEAGVSARATYLRSSNLLSVLGVSRPANLVLRIEQRGQVVHEVTRSEYRMNALLLSWNFYAILLVGLLAISRLSYFRRRGEFVSNVSA